MPMAAGCSAGLAPVSIRGILSDTYLHLRSPPVSLDRSPLARRDRGNCDRNLLPTGIVGCRTTDHTPATAISNRGKASRRDGGDSSWISNIEVAWGGVLNRGGKRESEAKSRR
jgi:hypothetical protein